MNMIHEHDNYYKLDFGPRHGHTVETDKESDMYRCIDMDLDIDIHRNGHEH